MADIHTPEFYPNTAFIGSYLSNPDEIDLARAVYVADFFSDGSPLLQRTFSTIASHELVSTDEERQERLNRTADQISDLMETSFVTLLAKGDQDSESPTFEATAIAEKGERLAHIWEMMLKSPFMLKVGEARGNGRELTKEELKNKPRRITHADDTLFYYDYARLDPKSGSKQQGGPGRESVVREAILEYGKHTGVTSIDNYLQQLRGNVLMGIYGTQLSAIRRRWEHWHPGQDFFSEGFRAAEKDTKSAIPLLLRPIAKVVLAAGSFALWRGIEKSVAEWEEVVRQTSASPEA